MKQIPSAYIGTYDGFGQDWISTSALSLLQMCGVAFYYKYVLRVPEGMTLRIGTGIGTHKGREANLSQKVKSKTDLALNQTQDAARDEVNRIFDTSEFIAEEEFADKNPKDARGIAVDKAVSFTTTDYNVFQKDLYPDAVEEILAVEFPELPRLIVGRIDTRLPGPIINDLKTSKRAKGQAFCDTSQGLTTYGLLAWGNLGGKPPEEYEVDNVIDASPKPARTERYFTKRTVEDIDRQVARFAAGMRAIEAGAFIPCNPEHWKCSRDYCGYWVKCKFGGGK